jgi:hypothetical protein
MWVVDGLSRAISEDKILNYFYGICLGQSRNITHLFSVDDALIFYSCVDSEGKCLKDILVFFF